MNAGRFERGSAHFQEVLLQRGIQVSAFEVDDVGTEYRRLRERRVVFTREPTDAGPALIAVLADNWGNLIELYKKKRG